MPVSAIGKYEFEPRDRVENFHGNILTYWNWVDHLMYSAALAIPLPPDMPFGKMIEEILPDVYGLHPDIKKVDWDAVEWWLDGALFSPDLTKSLADNGLGHKSVVRFRTPGLTGIGGSCS